MLWSRSERVKMSEENTFAKVLYIRTYQVCASVLREIRCSLLFRSDALQNNDSGHYQLEWFKLMGLLCPEANVSQTLISAALVWI